MKNVIKRICSVCVCILLVIGYQVVRQLLFPEEEVSKPTISREELSAIAGIECGEYLVGKDSLNFIGVHMPDSDEDYAQIRAFVEAKMAVLLPDIEVDYLYFSTVDQSFGLWTHKIYLETTTHTVGDTRSYLLEGTWEKRTLDPKYADQPSRLFWALNLDNETGQPVYFRDIYKVDNQLYQAFATAAEDTLSQDIEQLCAEQAFITGLSTEENYYWYPTEDGVCISFPVPTELGDHMEVTIPTNSLNPI